MIYVDSDARQSWSPRAKKPIVWWRNVAELQGGIRHGKLWPTLLESMGGYWAVIGWGWLKTGPKMRVCPEIEDSWPGLEDGRWWESCVPQCGIRIQDQHTSKVPGWARKRPSWSNSCSRSCWARSRHQSSVVEPLPEKQQNSRALNLFGSTLAVMSPE